MQEENKPNAHREYAENDIDLNKMSLERLWSAGLPVLRKIKNQLPTPTVVALRMTAVTLHGCLGMTGLAG